MIVKKLEAIYEGKAKIIYKTDDENLLIQHFKDHVTAFNNPKYEIIEDKGLINNEISAILLEKLKGILPTHFIKKLNEREQLIRKVSIIPLEVVVRNVAAGSFAKNFGIEVGQVLKMPSVEFFYKKDELMDPMISPNQIVVLGILEKEKIAKLEEYALKVNDVLKSIFANAGLTLVDFKIEFGFDSSGEIILADEISPDTCRLWETKTGKILDKDVFRKKLGNLTEAYREVLTKLKNI